MNRAVHHNMDSWGEQSRDQNQSAINKESKFEVTGMKGANKNPISRESCTSTETVERIAFNLNKQVVDKQMLLFVTVSQNITPTGFESLSLTHYPTS